MKITERYVAECDGVFAIAPIGRAISDAGVKAAIDIARKTSRNNVGIVCTKSEVRDIDKRSQFKLTASGYQSNRSGTRLDWPNESPSHGTYATTQLRH